MYDQYPIRTALVSVANKSGIVELAQTLEKNNIHIISTGGTAQTFDQHQITHQKVSDYTKFPEIMGGRVKTLHPHVFAGILARRDIDQKTLDDFAINTIDVVIVNLYPFVSTIKKNPDDLNLGIENIDIGGVALIRAAAKNYKSVTVITDPKDYEVFLTELTTNHGKISLALREQFALKAFQYTADYDSAIASYFHKQFKGSVLPDRLLLSYQKKQALRYGENPQQKAALYIKDPEDLSSVSTSTLLQGKELSYNNIQDSDAAWNAVNSFDVPACVIVKHTNPCGAALGNTLLESYQKALQCDPTSAFGGIIALNQPVDETLAEKIITEQFVEVIIAPGYSEQALSIFSQKQNLCLLRIAMKHARHNHCYTLSAINNGLLLQEKDKIRTAELEDFQVVTTQQPSDLQLQDLNFAWRMSLYVKSNAIVIAKNQMTIGLGVGQTSRVDSTSQAISKAQNFHHDLNASVLASDAFFPFADNVEIAARAGIKAIIQPGGSKRDPEVIEAANKNHIAMIFTGYRHFRH